MEIESLPKKLTTKTTIDQQINLVRMYETQMHVDYLIYPAKKKEKKSEKLTQHITPGGDLPETPETPPQSSLQSSPRSSPQSPKELPIQPQIEEKIEDFWDKILVEHTQILRQDVYPSYIHSNSTLLTVLNKYFDASANMPSIVIIGSQNTINKLHQNCTKLRDSAEKFRTNLPQKQKFETKLPENRLALFFECNTLNTDSEDLIMKKINEYLDDANIEGIFKKVALFITIFRNLQQYGNKKQNLILVKKLMEGKNSRVIATCVFDQISTEQIEIMTKIWPPDQQPIQPLLITLKDINQNIDVNQNINRFSGLGARSIGVGGLGARSIGAGSDISTSSGSSGGGKVNIPKHRSQSSIKTVSLTEHKDENKYDADTEEEEENIINNNDNNNLQLMPYLQTSHPKYILILIALVFDIASSFTFAFQVNLLSHNNTLSVPPTNQIKTSYMMMMSCDIILLIFIAILAIWSDKYERNNTLGQIIQIIILSTTLLHFLLSWNYYELPVRLSQIAHFLHLCLLLTALVLTIIFLAKKIDYNPLHY